VNPNFVIPSNTSYTANWQFTWWVHGFLGKTIYSVIPSCAVKKMRSISPSEDGIYTGYTLGDDNVFLKARGHRPICLFCLPNLCTLHFTSLKVALSEDEKITTIEAFPRKTGWRNQSGPCQKRWRNRLL